MGAITVGTEKVIKQLGESHGNISHAAIKLNTSRRVLHKYINEHSTVKEALDDIRESAKDRGEMMLQSRMATSDTLLIFYLKTQAHDRGYGDKSQVQHSGANGGAIGVHAEHSGKVQVEHGISDTTTTGVLDILRAIDAFAAVTEIDGDAEPTSAVVS